MSLANGPSAHLSWKELACKDGTPYPMKWAARASKLALIFEAIRAMCDGKPIRVSSAYRTPSHNKKIGGARNSQHMQGRALDLHPPKGWTADEFYHLIRGSAHDLGIGGIGRYNTFVHIDIRQSDNLVAWSGSGAKDSASVA